MKRFIVILIFSVFLFFLNGCGLSVRAVSNVKRPPTTSVKIYNINQLLPDNLERIGSITINDTGITADSKGSYEACMERIKKEAMKMGGNVVGIVILNAPDKHSSIYRMVADVYYQEIE